MKKIIHALAVVAAGALTGQAAAAEVEIKALNRSGSEFFAFSPDVVRIAPGDTVRFVAVDKGHQLHSIPGMIPEGATAFDSAMNEDITVTFTVAGVYVIACRPHLAMGMVALVVVGQPEKLNGINPDSLPGKAKSKLAALLQSVVGR